MGVEVHHIIPSEEHGPDTEDNAAPLCPSCHDAFGANPQKRKFIREARDLWYEICATRYHSDRTRLNEIERLLKETVSRADFAAFRDELLKHLGKHAETPSKAAANAKDIEDRRERDTERAFFSVQMRSSLERIVNKLWSRLTGNVKADHTSFIRMLDDLGKHKLVPNGVLDAAKEVHIITSCVLHDVSITTDQWRFVCLVAPQIATAFFELL